MQDNMGQTGRTWETSHVGFTPHIALLKGLCSGEFGTYKFCLRRLGSRVATQGPSTQV